MIHDVAVVFSTSMHLFIVLASVCLTLIALALLVIAERLGEIRDALKADAPMVEPPEVPPFPLTDYSTAEVWQKRHDAGLCDYRCGCKAAEDADLSAIPFTLNREYALRVLREEPGLKLISTFGGYPNAKGEKSERWIEWWRSDSPPFAVRIEARNYGRDAKIYTNAPPELIAKLKLVPHDDDEGPAE